MAVDVAGNIYVVDADPILLSNGNNVIRILQPAPAAPPSINVNGLVDAAAYRPS